MNLTTHGSAISLCALAAKASALTAVDYAKP
jgi:hypothetical protein